MSPRALIIIGLAIALPASARAQPRVQPTRDVVVTYRVEGPATGLVPGGLPGPVRLSWDAIGRRVRAETDARTQVAILDLSNHTGMVLDTGLRVILPLPIRPEDLQPLTLEGARLKPGATETVAGLSCTAYAVESPHAAGSVCLTADGIALRGAGTVRGKPGSFVATSVRYGPLPPSVFAAPPGYMALNGPGGKVDLRALGNSLGLSLAPR